MFDLAYGYARNRMTAYVDLQEREFAAEERGYTATKHQREVGAGYFDRIATTVDPNTSTTALEGLHRRGPVPLDGSTAGLAASQRSTCRHRAAARPIVRARPRSSRMLTE